MHIAICDRDTASGDTLELFIESYAAKHNADIETFLFDTAEDLLENLGTVGCPYDTIIFDAETADFAGADVPARVREHAPNIDFAYVAPTAVYLERRRDSWGLGCALKPLTSERVFTLCDTLLTHHNKTKGCYTLRLRDGDTAEVFYRDIMYVEARWHTLEAVLYRERYIYMGEIKSEEKTLAPYGFVRVHRNFLVNVAFMHIVDEGHVTLPTGHRIEIGAEYLRNVKEVFRLSKT